MPAQPGSPAISPRSSPLRRRAAGTTLSAETCRTYISRVRQYLAWLAATHRRRPGDQDPLASPKARDFAVRDYRRWLLHEGPIKRSVVYANSALTAIDDFYLRRGLCATKIDRDDLPRQAPRALEEKARIRWLRAVEQAASPRDRCIAPSGRRRTRTLV